MTNTPEDSTTATQSAGGWIGIELTLDQLGKALDMDLIDVHVNKGDTEPFVFLKATRVGRLRGLAEVRGDMNLVFERNDNASQVGS